MFGVQSKWLFGGWMFNRSCSVDFFVPHFWAAFLTLNPLACTSFTALVKVVDRLLFCILQLLRKGLYKIRRFPSVSAYAFRIANTLLPFPLTLAFLTYFCIHLSFTIFTVVYCGLTKYSRTPVT